MPTRRQYLRNQSVAGHEQRIRRMLTPERIADLATAACQGERPVWDGLCLLQLPMRYLLHFPRLPQ